MKKFKKLTRKEMKKVNGGSDGTCTIGKACNVIDEFGVNHIGACTHLCYCITSDGFNAHTCIPD